LAADVVNSILLLNTSREAARLVPPELRAAFSESMGEHPETLTGGADGCERSGSGRPFDRTTAAPRDAGCCSPGFVRQPPPVAGGSRLPPAPDSADCICREAPTASWTSTPRVIAIRDKRSHGKPIVHERLGDIALMSNRAAVGRVLLAHSDRASRGLGGWRLGKAPPMHCAFPPSDRAEGR
jgi:hypothetical protein